MLLANYSTFSFVLFGSPGDSMDFIGVGMAVPIYVEKFDFRGSFSSWMLGSGSIVTIFRAKIVVF